jgi:predicted nucleic acid-binding Zn ribbon protein
MDQNELQQQHDRKTKQRERVIKMLMYLMTILVVTLVVAGILIKLEII